MAASVRAATTHNRLEATLRDLVRAAVDHTGAPYGALSVLALDGVQVDRCVVVGPSVPLHRGPVPAEPELRGLLADLAAPPAADGSVLPLGSLAVPIRSGRTVVGHLYLAGGNDRSPFTATEQDTVAAVAAVAALAVVNARLAELADCRRAWAQAGTEIMTSLLSGQDADQVLRETAERVGRLADADRAGVLVPSPDDEDALTISVAIGDTSSGDPADVEGVRVPLSGTRLRQAVEQARPVVLDDTRALVEHPTYAPVFRELVGYDFGPVLLLPLPGRPSPATVVAARRSGRQAFDVDTVELAASFATQVGVALELTRSHEREQRLQVVADRDRIALDLHDHVVQRIYATGLALDRIGRSLEGTTPEAAARLAERVDELDQTIVRIRTAIFGLREDSDAEPGAVRARLAEVVRSVTDGHGLRVDVRIDGDCDELPPDLVHDVVAVVRELVTNVVRHAGASRVSVDVDVAEDITVEVTDDGRGLPGVTTRSGLANLAKRAQRYGGELQVTPGPPGTQLRWTAARPDGDDQLT